MNLKEAKYLLEKTRQNYNQVAEDFSRQRERPWPEAKFLVDDYLVSGEKILDLGCGAGQWSEFFKEKKVEYIGVDFSEKLIEIAKNRYPDAEFKVANVLALPFPDNYFDKVYAIALFHHLPSNEFRKVVFKEIERVLKKKGILILTCWDLWQKRKTRRLIYKFILLKIFGKSKLDFKDILMNWQGMEDGYFHCFTKNELRKLVKDANFKIIKDGKFLVGIEEKKASSLPNSNLYLVAEK